MASQELLQRAESKCELCNSQAQLNAFLVAPKSEENLSTQALICSICEEQISNADKVESNHWRCLTESMWSQEPPVQVIAYRMLKQLKKEDWAADLLNLLFLDESTLNWAEALDQSKSEAIVHKDSNGNILSSGDTVVLIKDLNVKGANFTAKRGTAVRRISLDPNNANHIEGRVNDQHIVILTQFVKKS